MYCKNKKFLAPLLTLLLTLSCFNYSFATDEMPDSFDNITALENYMQNDIIFLNIQNGGTRNNYLIEPVDENSYDRYEEIVGSDGDKYLNRIREVRFVEASAGPVTGLIPICNVSIGKSYTTTETTTISHETSFEKITTTGGSITLQHKVSSGISLEVIKFGVDTSVSVEASISKTLKEGTVDTHTYTVQKGVTYSFPSSFEQQGYNSAQYYSGFDKDEYEVITDVIPKNEKYTSNKYAGMVSNEMVPTSSHKIGVSSTGVAADYDYFIHNNIPARYVFTISGDMGVVIKYADGHYGCEDLNVFNQKIASHEIKYYTTSQSLIYPQSNRVTIKSSYKIPYGIEFAEGRNYVLP